MLDALTELEHTSLKLQDSQLTPPEAAHCLISLKYDFQPVTQNSEEFYEWSQNVANKLYFKGIKLKFGKVHISQQDSTQKLI
jgi:hypothetical protein